MPKPGLKYFSGSFLLSLVAVFAAAKAYILLMANEQSVQAVTAVEAKDIELFAVNEENDPIYDKFKAVSSVESPLNDNTDSLAEQAAEVLPAFSDEVLYEPQDDDNDKTEVVAQTNTEDELTIADASEFVDESENTADSEPENELQIADAAEAPTFMIPLKHNYNVEGGTVTVSDTASSGHIALASNDVSIYNLGTQNQASVTDPLEENETDAKANDNTSEAEVSANNGNIAEQNANDDPWDVAQTANKHTAKNLFSYKGQTEEAEVALPAQETKTAYRPQQNILIPIPEDIMNEDNLVPQFSSSKENLELERELRAKNKLPASETKDGGSKKESPAQAPAKEVRPMPTIPSDDTEKDFDDKKSNADEQSYRSLTDDITAWFTGGKSKNVDKKATDESTKNTEAKVKNKKIIAGKPQGRSMFQRLLGPQKEERDIAPTELKITFQPNKAEISGQTLEWLRAFAANALNNYDVSIEIRASESSTPAIQRKRVNLLYKVLADEGVEYHKINVIFTNREPNSFIIRNMRYATEEEIAKTNVKLGDNPW